MGLQSFFSKNNIKNSSYEELINLLSSKKYKEVEKKMEKVEYRKLYGHNGETLFHLLARTSKEKETNLCIRLLRNSKTRTDCLTLDKSGNTPLHVAASSGGEALVGQYASTCCELGVLEYGCSGENKEYQSVVWLATQAENKAFVLNLIKFFGPEALIPQLKRSSSLAPKSALCCIEDLGWTDVIEKLKTNIFFGEDRYSDFREKCLLDEESFSGRIAPMI